MNGYYSPHLFQLYELIWLLEVHSSDKLLVQFYAGGGLTKDETTSLGLATDFGAQAKYHFYKNVDLVAEIDYLTRAISPTYRELDLSLGLTCLF